MDLELKGNNLYRNGILVEFDVSNEVVLLREPINYEPEENDIYHTVRDSDRLDLLAYKYYGGLIEDSSKFWWIIADVNNAEFPLDLSSFVGKQLLIPDLFKVLLSIQ